MNHFKYYFFILLLLVINTQTQRIYSINKETPPKLLVIPTGRITMDAALFIEDKTKLSNGVAFSNIRLGIKSDYDKWKLKIDISFTNEKLTPKDVYVKYHFTKKSLITIGHFLEPFGLEAIQGASKRSFFTSSVSTEAFKPGRKLGISYTHYNPFFWNEIGFFGDGKSMKNKYEGDDGYSITSRIVFNPIQKAGSFFHIGLAGSYRKADANGIDEETNKKNPKEIIYSSPLLTQVKKKDFLSATITNANYQAKYTIELLSAYGPIAFQGEYFHSTIKRHLGLTSYQANGVYAQLSYLILGDSYTYSSDRARPGKRKPKELEVALRYNYTDLNCNKSNIFGGRSSDWSLAVNYQLNNYISFKLNYSYIKLGKHTPLAAGEKINLFQARALYIF